MSVIRPFLVTVGLLAVSFSSLLGADPPAQKSAETGAASYYRDIRRIFQQNCQGCHQPAKPMGGYVMTTHASLLDKGESGEQGIVPGKPEQSKIVAQITSHDGKPPAMPKGKDRLTDFEVTLIKKWIAQGAKDDTPASALQTVDAEHPPMYFQPPVITSLDYSPDGNLLAVSGYHEVLLFKADGSSQVARLVGLSERVQSLAFSPDGKQLAVTGGDPGRFGEVQIWDVVKQKLKVSVLSTFDTVYGVSWSPDGTKIAYGCADNTLRALDSKTGKQVLFQGAHSDWVLDTIFSTDGSHLISVSRDMSMKLTEVATQRFVDNVTSITPGALKGGLMSVARHPKKDELLIGGSDGEAKIYKMYRDKKRVIGDDFNRLRVFEKLPGRIFKARYNVDGSRVVVSSSFEGKGEVRIFAADTGKLVAKLAGQQGAVYAVAYRPDGKQVASAGFDGLVRLNDPQTGKLIKEFVPFPISVSRVTLNAK